MNKHVILSKSYSGASLRSQVHLFVDEFIQALHGKPICRSRIAFKGQISETTIEGYEAKLLPVTRSARRPVYRGPMADKLHFDRFCQCSVLYENQIIVPKGHSVIVLCPKCGCVTQD